MVHWTWVYSLRVRLLVTFLFVLTLMALFLAVLSSSSVTRRFESYLADERVRTVQTLENLQTNISEVVEGYYDLSSGWTAGVNRALNEMSTAMGYPLVLMDARRFQIASTLDIADVTLLREMMYETAAPVVVKNSAGEEQTVGYLYLHAPLPALEEGSDQAFIIASNQALGLAALVAGFLAMVLIFLLMNPVLQTVEAMTDAANRMAAGDLEQRVQVRSKGEIGQLAQAFNRMNEHLIRQEDLRRGMVSDIAHELRAPLSNMRAYMEALRDGVIQPDAALFGSLHDQVLMLNRVVDDLQQLALVDAGRLKLHFQRVDLRSTVSQIIAVMQPLNSEVVIRNDVPLDLPRLYVDTERLWQILTNLIKNSLAYSSGDSGVPAGSICIEARLEEGLIDGDRIAIRVKDTGEGIAPEHLENIFERFYRVDPSRTRATGGAGLGLSIVKELVDAHGGSIHAESVVGEGTTMTIYFPYVPEG